ncbi:MAG: hypothetical protein H0V95_13990 [Actinobacteria bacterium]|nr:hypothetical protein [Actinomycetota bacterium]
MDNKITPGEIVVMAAGAVALIASFLPFYKQETFNAELETVDKNFSAWSSDFPFLFPVATLIAIFAVVAGLLVVLTKFANVDLSRGFLGFGFTQLLLALGFFSAILALAYLIQDKGTTDTGFGYWLLLIAALASIVGAVLIRNERGATGTV